MSSGRLLGGIAVGLLLVACTGGGAATTDSGVEPSAPSTIATTAVETTVTTAGPVETIPREDVPPLALYLAAIDRGLMGTEYEGDVYLDPDSYVSVGRLFCALLDADVTPSEVLRSYIGALEEESGELSDDDLVLGGVILGASVQLICPDYLDDLQAIQDE